MRISDWSSDVCSSDLFERWVIRPNRRIVEKLKAIHPDIPVIGFPKGAGAKLADYARGTGVDAVGVDETVDPHWADRALPEGLPVQGNLDPLALLAGGKAMEQSVDTIDRTSVVSGQSGSVRVACGAGRILQKQNNITRS